MSGFRETARQKMIGMMYLVLTAMLALNVSSSVLDGFTLVDNSLHKSIESSETRNKALYNEIQYLYNKNPDLIGACYDNANLVKKKSQDLYKYIEGFKVQIVKMADQKVANDSAYVKHLLAKDNMDAASEFAVTKGNGKKLKQKIEDYRNFLIDLSAGYPEKQKRYKDIFATGNILDGKPWVLALFEMMPAAAVITILTKFQNDIRSSETEIFQILQAQNDAMGYHVNKMNALVIANSHYVVRGGKYSAQFMLSASDTTKIPEYFVGSTSVPNGLYEVNCTKPGLFTYSGQVKLTGSDGAIRSYPFQSDYIVGEQSATFTNDDLNILYRGIDNKFSITVPGIAPENISARSSGGIVQKVGSNFSIRVNQDGNINIVAFANIKGKDQPIGDGSFRIKYLPDPKSYLRYTDAGGITRLVQDATLTKRLLKADGVTLVASYGQDQLIRANFTITSFTMLTVFGSVNADGSHFNAKQLSDIDKLESGGILTLKNIKALGPDGKIRLLGLIQIQV